MTASKNCKVITDLDQIDMQMLENEEKKHLSRIKCMKKDLKKYSGNFPVRSRSAEWKPKKMGTNLEILDLIKAKDKQVESLIQRVVLLHKCNNQFAKENKKLLSVLQQRSNPTESDEYKKLTMERDKILEINNDLQNDIAMMKVLVYRLNVQIESYQEKLGNPSPSDETPRNDNAEWKNVKHWGAVNSETLGPLLNSYEEMIKDKNDLIDQHDKEFKYFTAELKKIIEENQRLQEQYDILKRSSNGWLESKTRFLSQIDSIKSKLDVQTRRADLAKEKLLEVIQCYEQKTQTLSLDLEHLQNAYAKCKQELVVFKSNNTNSPDAVVESLKECKKLFEELKLQHSNEKLDLTAKVDELNKQNSELKQQNELLLRNQEAVKKEFQIERHLFDELKRKTMGLQKISEKLKRSRDRLKARLKIALQWAQKLEQEQAQVQNTWDSVKRLETMLKHKDAQLKGLHARHVEEMEKMRQKMQQKEDTIKNILKSKVNT